MSDEEIKDRYGDLTSDEITRVRSQMESMGTDMELDTAVHDLLKASSKMADGVAPPLPESVRESFEAARLSSENASNSADVYATPKRYAPVSKSNAVSMSRWHSSAVITGGLAAAAAIVVAYVTYIRPVEPSVSVMYAEAATLLTPGDETGFLEPIFTWNSDSGGVVDIRVSTRGGVEVASLTNAFSPLRWSSLQSESSLRAGETYQLELVGNEGVLIKRQFSTGQEAGGAPRPDDSVEAIVEQCEQLIAENRPADAWMLWGELTGEQKSHPRMQELKELILAEIAG